MTSHELEVLRRIEEEMTRDPVTGTLTLRYPWKEEKVARMSDNKWQAVKVQSQIEKRLVKTGRLAQFNQEMEKAIGAGAVRELSSEEMGKYQGPIHYISVFAVFKPGSVSTPLRIVSNSAMKSATSGLSLNDCIEEGPNILADLLEVLIHWRTVQTALHVDIRKAYQALHTTEKELHLRRFVWRRSPNDQWTTWAYDRVTFGDNISGVLLEVAKKTAARLGTHIDPDAAKQLIDNTYVDDAILGGSPELVRKMETAVPIILKQCGLEAKYVVASDRYTPENEESLGGKILGLDYSLKHDEISCQMKAEVLEGKRCRGLRKTVILTMHDVMNIRKGTRKFTRREALSLVMGFFDPLGLMSPVSIKGKLLLQRLHMEDKLPGWDQDMDPRFKDKWASLIEEIINAPEVIFHRSTRPQGAVGSPSLVGFGDGSMAAFCATLYIRWNVEGQVGAISRLLMAKARVSPARGTTVPRAEIQGLVVTTRMAAHACKAAASPFERVIIATDSGCSVAASQRAGGLMNIYFANRVGEIHERRREMAAESVTVEDISWVPGLENPADLGTRGKAKAEDLGPGSRWQHGPHFLSLPRERWPLTTEVTETIPAGEMRRSAQIHVTRGHCTACATEYKGTPRGQGGESGPPHGSTASVSQGPILEKVAQGPRRWEKTWRKKHLMAGWMSKTIQAINLSVNSWDGTQARLA
jgi:hypothetical protein